MNIIFRIALVFCLTIAHTKSIASANTFINEVERLVAISDKTYTVIVSQYEQTYSYWTGISRMMVRVVDINTNKIISQVLLSSVQIDRAMEKPYASSFSLLEDELPALKNIPLNLQSLYNNLEYPKYRFNIDSRGVYLNKNGRTDVLDYDTVERRFSSAGADLDHPIDVNYKLALDIEADDTEFTGWYKTEVDGRQRYFFVLKIGLQNDDTGSLEYVFSIPNPL
ncbi:MAG: hypothetical protein KTR35_06230 [Gammaproteobacteria bacterium]|nr:hypothetical protein [Gammaproteobacteria bacterium]